MYLCKNDAFRSNRLLRPMFWVQVWIRESSGVRTGDLQGYMLVIYIYIYIYIYTYVYTYWTHPETRSRLLTVKQCRETSEGCRQSHLCCFCWRSSRTQAPSTGDKHTQPQRAYYHDEASSLLLLTKKERNVFESWILGDLVWRVPCWCWLWFGLSEWHHGM